jgi:hypothetical protein
VRACDVCVGDTCAYVCSMCSMCCGVCVCVLAMAMSCVCVCVCCDAMRISLSLSLSLSVLCVHVCAFWMLRCRACVCMLADDAFAFCVRVLAMMRWRALALSRPIVHARSTCALCAFDVLAATHSCVRHTHVRGSLTSLSQRQVGDLRVHMEARQRAERALADASAVWEETRRQLERTIGTLRQRNEELESEQVRALRTCVRALAIAARSNAHKHSRTETPASPATAAARARVAPRRRSERGCGVRGQCGCRHERRRAQ